MGHRVRLTVAQDNNLIDGYSYIARHNAELAQAVVDAGAVPLLVLCVQEPELSLKRIAASALSDISKHSPELAQTVVDAGTNKWNAGRSQCVFKYHFRGCSILGTTDHQQRCKIKETGLLSFGSDSQALSGACRISCGRRDISRCP